MAIDQKADANGRPVVLVICDYYLPGFESGGAMRTLVNMVDRLSEEFDFRLITRDHDGPLDRTTYRNVLINDWNRVGNADVYYLSKDNVTSAHLRKLINDLKSDAIYLNSFFSPLTVYTLILRRMGRIREIPMIIAPEGEFSKGALAIKSLKKQLYIKSAKLLRLLDGIVWKAAAESESEDIKRVLGGKRQIFIAPNMPPSVIFESYDQALKPEKVPGSFTMVFLSRFMRKKNFNWLAEHIGSVTGDLRIDIYGPLEEADYWSETQRLAAKLPKNITIEAKGPVPHEQVAPTLARYHFFILPTLGENFGHVFIEAFAAGCPVITSDRTPWRGLDEKGIGWDLSLDDPQPWLNAIDECIAMPGEEYIKRSQRARQFAVDWLSDPALEVTNREVIRSAIKKN